MRYNTAIMEEQRYGRNKATQINHAYIDSGEYRKKFDRISDNPELNKMLFNLAKVSLKHRAGTCYEDMYWIDPDTAKVIVKEVDGKEEECVNYSESTKRIVDSTPGLLTIHNHPNSFPPSAADFNSSYEHQYQLGVVCCHDGRVFVYKADESLDENLYNHYIQRYRLEGCNEYDAQWNALNDIAQNTGIAFKEVRVDE